MQDAEEPDFNSEALWIGADFEHSCGAGFKQEMEERPLVLPDERHQFMRNTEHDVEVVHRQGFEGIHEVKRCELEPNGTFYLEAKKPSNDDLARQRLKNLTPFGVK